MKQEKYFIISPQEQVFKKDLVCFTRSIQKIRNKTNCRVKTPTFVFISENQCKMWFQYCFRKKPIFFEEMMMCTDHIVMQTDSSTLEEGGKCHEGAHLI